MAGNNTLATSHASAPWNTMKDIPERSILAMQIGLQLTEAIKKFSITPEITTQISTLFDIYAQNSRMEGKVPEDKLEALIEEFRGSKPERSELNIVKRSPGDDGKHVIAKDDLLEALLILKIHRYYERDIDTLFYLYDGNCNGKLEDDELRHVLQEVSGREVPDAEVHQLKERYAPGAEAHGIKRHAFTNIVSHIKVVNVKNASSSRSVSGGSGTDPERAGCVGRTRSCLPF